MSGFRTIVYPTDFSENSLEAVPRLLELVETFDAEVHLIYVVEPAVAPYDSVWAMSDRPEFGQNREQNLLEQLRRVREQIGLDADRHRVAVVYGRPHEQIVEYCRENGADLVVMATHGHTGLKHALIGSTTERVVRQSPCPVLTVRHADQPASIPSRR